MSTTEKHEGKLGIKVSKVGSLVAKNTQVLLPYFMLSICGSGALQQVWGLCTFWAFNTQGFKAPLYTHFEHEKLKCLRIKGFSFLQTAFFTHWLNIYLQCSQTLPSKVSVDQSFGMFVSNNTFQPQKKHLSVFQYYGNIHFYNVTLIYYKSQTYLNLILYCFILLQCN